MTLTTPGRDRADATITTLTGHGAALRCLGGAAAPASAAWPAANQAFFIPFYVATTVTAVEMFWWSGTSPGTANYDLGIYDDLGTRIVSLGATATVNTTDLIQPAGGADIADTVLVRDRYYMAISAAATTVTARSFTQSAGVIRAIGVKTMATAHPLPATATFASLGTTNFLPYMGILTITNML